MKNCGNNMKLHMSLFVDGMADQFFEYFRGKSTYTFDELESGMLELIQMLLEVPQC
ncbi:MAG: hypothetical protein JXA46_16120 [Dehalococcoidales bacterium]|nr:hypothetical protein [Dehalococcoidales bacterium]